MALYHIRLGSGILQESKVLGEASVEAKFETAALHKAFPQFRWIGSVWNRIRGCMVYSNSDCTWAEVKEIFDTEI